MTNRTRHLISLLLSLALLLVVLLFVVSYGLKAQSRRWVPKDAVPLHTCVPTPQQLAALQLAGREIVDTKCDASGGVWVLSRPKQPRKKGQ